MLVRTYILAHDFDSGSVSHDDKGENEVSKELDKSTTPRMGQSPSAESTVEERCENEASEAARYRKHYKCIECAQVNLPVTRGIDIR